MNTCKNCPGLPWHDPALCAYIDAGHPLQQWFNPYPGVWSTRDNGRGGNINYRELYTGKEGAD